jgi:hypothetical protein
MEDLIVNGLALIIWVYVAILSYRSLFESMDRHIAAKKDYLLNFWFEFESEFYLKMLKSAKLKLVFSILLFFLSLVGVSLLFSMYLMKVYKLWNI